MRKTSGLLVVSIEAALQGVHAFSLAEQSLHPKIRFFLIEITGPFEVPILYLSSVNVSTILLFFK